MNKLILAFLLPALFFSSCNLNNKKKGVLQINLPNKEHSGYIKSPFVLEKIIALENTPPLSWAQRILFSDKSIYILDEYSQFCKFNYEGKVEYVIQAQGKGPGEYSKAKDFIINKEQNLLIIADEGQKKFLYYHLETGKYISERKINIGFMKFTQSENSYFVTTPYRNMYNPIPGREMCNIYQLDDELNPMYGYIPQTELNESNLTNGGGYPFFYSSNKVFYTKKYSGEVYEIKNDSIIKKIELICKEDIWHKIKGRRIVFGVTNVVELDSILYFEYEAPSKLYYGLYDLNRQKLLFFEDFPSFIPTKDFPLVNMFINGVADHSFVRIIDPSRIKLELEMAKKAGYTFEIPQEFKDVDINDNPLLLFFKLDLEGI